jgi:hypothetical protein
MGIGNYQHTGWVHTWRIVYGRLCGGRSLSPTGTFEYFPPFWSVLSDSARSLPEIEMIETALATIKCAVATDSAPWIQLTSVVDGMKTYCMDDG